MHTHMQAHAHTHTHARGEITIPVLLNSQEEEMHSIL